MSKENLGYDETPNDYDEIEQRVRSRKGSSAVKSPSHYPSLNEKNVLDEIRSRTKSWGNENEMRRKYSHLHSRLSSRHASGTNNPIAIVDSDDARRMTNMISFGGNLGSQIDSVSMQKLDITNLVDNNGPTLSSFLLSCVALSVGLGNVWRFPFTAYENGGGAFLIPYMIVLFLIGRPLYFMELAMGQFSSRNTINVWDVVPSLRGVGMSQLTATVFVISYYVVLIALSIFYLIASFSYELPWAVCREPLVDNNTICVPIGSSSANVVANLTAQGILEPGRNYTNFISAPENYYANDVLHLINDISDGIGMPDWKLAICLFASYVIIFFIMWKGVTSSGKFSYVLAVFPYIVLLTLLGRGVTLYGALNGIKFFITPDWSALFKVKVWYAAVSQSFFSLSVGFGSLITFGSYNSFRHDIYRDVVIISVIDTLTSLLAGFTIFSVLGNLAYELDEPVKDVIKGGQGLAFISYPMAISKFDLAPQFFAVMFFLMLITLGLGSATGLLQGVISALSETKSNPISKAKATFIVCICMFFSGLVYITPGGQHMLALVDYFGGGFIIFITVIFESIGIHYIYGMRNFIRDLKFIIGFEVGWYWKLCWFIIVPLTLISISVISIISFEPLVVGGLPLPFAAEACGWALVAFALIQIPYWWIHESFLYPGTTCFGKLSGTWRTPVEWGPLDQNDYIEWKKVVMEEEHERRREHEHEFQLYSKSNA